MKGTHKLFRGKRRGKRLVFVYTLSGRTLKVITKFSNFRVSKLQIFQFSSFKTQKLTNLEFQNSKIERFRVLKLKNLKSSSLVNIH